MSLFTPKNRLTAITASGIELGRVTSVDINPDTGRVQTFFVVSNKVIPRLMDNELAISWNQIVDWQADKIIVADTAVTVQNKNIALAPEPTSGTMLSDRQKV